MVFNNKLYEQKRQKEAARRRQKEEAERKRRQEEERRKRVKKEQQELLRSQRESKMVKVNSVKATQSLLNGFGFTDNRGNPLKEDGVLGAKTKEATKKFGRYQEGS